MLGVWNKKCTYLYHCLYTMLYSWYSFFFYIFVKKYKMHIIHKIIKYTQNKVCIMIFQGYNKSLFRFHFVNAFLNIWIFIKNHKLFIIYHSLRNKDLLKTKLDRIFHCENIMSTCILNAAIRYHFRSIPTLSFSSLELLHITTGTSYNMCIYAGMHVPSSKETSFQFLVLTIGRLSRL